MNVNGKEAKKHPNHRNHKELCRMVDEHFKTRIMRGDYASCQNVLTEMLQICLDADGCPRERQAKIVATMIQNCVDSRQPLLAKASAADVKKFG